MKNKKEMRIMQNHYIDAMVKKMPALRATTKMTQAVLAEKIGVGRQSIVSIETGKRPMTWSLYLAVCCIFEQYEDSKKLLEIYELFDAEFVKAI